MNTRLRRRKIRRRGASASRYRSRQPAIVGEILEDRRLLSVTNGELAGGEANGPLWIDGFVEPVGNPFSTSAATSDYLLSRAESMPHVAGQIIAAVRAPRPDVGAWRLGGAWRQRLPSNPIASTHAILTSAGPDGDSVTLWKVAYAGAASASEVLRAMDADVDIVWASPDFVYAGSDPRDLIPNDPLYLQQYHHALMQTQEAWDISVGQSQVIVAVTDDGVDLDHADLSNAIWTNAAEIAANGIDDDGNGYIDDVRGWDFIGQDNDPSHNSSDVHGTHVSGIAAAGLNNGIGIAGTAGGVTLMPLRFFDSNDTLRFTSSTIAETFAYAVDNGARIVNTSYSIDYFVGDPVFTAGLQYLHDQGAIHFNSAGNDKQQDPTRIAFEQSLMVASTDNNDTLSWFSNYGGGIDVSAPGSSIYSTFPHDGYQFLSGTSMAAPNAAGVAALIWSHHPTWTRDQVVAQLLATADDIDILNPGKETLLGSGRVNALRSLTESLGAPRITELTFLSAGNHAGDPDSVAGFTMSFSQFMDPQGVMDPDSYDFRDAGLDGLFMTADDIPLELTFPQTYMIGTNEFRIEVKDGPLDFGSYRLTLQAGGLRNPFGTELDGDDDSSAGGDYVFEFNVAPPALHPVLPLGSLIHESRFAQSLAEANEEDSFSYSLEAGQKISIDIQGQSPLVPAIRIVDSNGTPLLDSVAAGNRLTVQNFELPVSDDYRFTVYGANQSFGAYTAHILLNSAFESEGLVPFENGSAASSEGLLEASILLGTDGADRSAVWGSFESQFSAPSLVEDFESGGLNDDWTTQSSHPTGIVEVQPGLATPNGDFALAFGAGPGSVNVANEATWSVNVAGTGKPVLRYRQVSWDDANDPLPESYTGSVVGDGISFSIDGNQWFRLADLVPPNPGVWHDESIDVYEAVAAAGLAWNFDTIQLKFQTFGHGTVTQGGRAIDDLRIESRESGSDWYGFDLDDGQSLSLVATQFNTKLAGETPLSLELYAADGQTRLAVGAGTDNATAVLSSYRDRSMNGVPDRYYARLTGQSGQYSLLALRDADFDLESQPITLGGQVMHQSAVLGFVTNNLDYTAEPDAAPNGTFVTTFFPSVTLSAEAGEAVRVQSISSATSTGTQVFAHADGGVSWSENGWQLRADFDMPMDYVSIDVVADDLTDVGILRAYDGAGSLVGETVSPIAAPGQAATMSVHRPSADIRYVTMSGLGKDSVMLDHLRYGEQSGADQFIFEMAANESVLISASSPKQASYEFPGDALFQEGNVSLELELADENGVVLSVGGTSIDFTAGTSGSYVLTVNSTNAAGEYFIEFDQPLAPGPALQVIAASTPLQPTAIGAFPSTYTVQFSDTIELSSVQPGDLEVNGFSAVDIASAQSDSITFILDEATNQGAGTYNVTLAADAVHDLPNQGNIAFATQFTLQPLSPFEPVGIEGGQAFVSRNLSLTVDPSTTSQFSLFLRAGESLSALASPFNPLASLSLALGDANGTSNAPGAGNTAALGPFTATSDQFVTITVSSDVTTEFGLDVYRNVSIDDLFDADPPSELVSYLDTLSLPRYHALGTTDGLFPDELQIELFASSDHPWDFVLMGTTTPWNGTLQLVDSSGFVWAEGAPASSSEHDLAIQDFVPQESGIYYLRIESDAPQDYAIMASAGIAIDANTSPIAPLRDLTGRSGLIGSTSTGNDRYQIHLAKGETLLVDRLPTTRPLDDRFDAHSSAAELILRDPSGQLAPPMVVTIDANGTRSVFSTAVTGTYEIEVIGTANFPAYAFRLGTSASVDVDFDNDGAVDCQDVGALVSAITATIHNPQYDLDDNGLVDLADLNLWRAEAATANGLMLPYKPGDANLDGYVDVGDFNIWNNHRFTATGDWCQGDFDANGVTDISDFNIWNGNKFTSSIAANVTISDASAIEGQPLLFDVQLSDALQGSVQLNLLAGSGSATGALLAGNGADFDYHGFEYSLDDGAHWLPTAGNSGSEVLIPAGTYEFKVRINTFEDAVSEPNEFFALSAFAVAGPIFDIFPGRGTIVDNDETTTITIGDASATEGDAVVFSVTMDTATEAELRLDLSTTPIDATSDVDFESANFDVSMDDGVTWQPATGIAGTEWTVPAGTSQFLVRVDTFEDSEVESVESFLLTAFVVDGPMIVIIDGVGMIQDDDAPNVEISDAGGIEGTYLEFNVAVSTPPLADTRLELGTQDVTAIGGLDFQLDGFEFSTDGGGTWLLAAGVEGREVVIPAGQASIQVRIATVDDVVFEADESFVLYATALDDNVAMITPGAGTIQNNDLAPSVLFNDAIVTEGADLLFFAHLSNPSYEDIVIDLSAIEGSASSGTDYDAQQVEYSLDSGTNWQPAEGAGQSELTFPAGRLGILLRFPTIDDEIYESTESMTLSASLLAGTVTDIGYGSGFISDNESPPTLSISDDSATEGQPLSFSLTTDLVASFDITLSLTTNDIEAVGGSDPVANPEIDYDNLNLEYFDGTDWQPIVAGEVTLLAGSTTLDVRVATFDDAELELDETFELTATESVPGSLATPSATGIGTIRDNEPAPTLTIAPAESDEGDFVTFALTLDSASPSDITLALTTNDIDAVGGSDPVANPEIDYDNLNLEYFDGTDWQPIVAGEVTLLAGSTTLDVRVATFDDAELELDETFELMATESVPGSLATPSATGIGTIRDNESAPTLAIAPAEADEGDFITFTLTLDSASPSDITLALTTNDIEAVGGSDPVANPEIDYDNLNLEYFDGTDWQPVVSSEVTLLAGSTTLDVRVATFDDAELELDETFELMATEIVPGNLAVPTATGIGTIRDNESAPSLTIAPAETDEGDFVTFTLTLDSVSPSDITLALTTNDIDALGGSDPVANPEIDYDNLNLEYFDGTAWQPIVAGEVTLLAGTTTLDVRVATFDDAELELDETFELIATEILSGSLATPSATGIGTIRDNESAPTLAIAPAEADEGDFITFTLTLDSASPSDITLALTTNDIDALGGSDPGADYDNLNLEYFDGTDWQPIVAGEVTLLAGSTTLDVRVATFDDAELELDETFELIATESVPGSLATPSATGIGTIRDNELAPTLTIAPAEADEGDFITFALTLDSVSPSDITLALTTNDIEAVGGSDPVANPAIDYDNLNLEYFDGTDWQPVVAGEVTLLAGSTTLDVRVATFDDAELELDETFELMATETVPGSLAVPTATGIGTIRDNESAPTLTIAPAETDEGDFITFTLTLDSASPSDITLALTTNDIEAVGGSDPVANPAIDYDNLNLEYFDGTNWQPIVAGEVTLLAGSTTLDVRVATFDDAELELDETFELIATETVPGSLATPSATGIGTIRDNESAPTLAIAPAEADEGDFITFTLTLDSASPSDITLALTTNDIDALGGSDPVANPEIDYDNLNLEYFDGTDWQPVVSSEVTLLAGTTTLDVRVATFDDAELELDETFELMATEIVPGSLATPSATGIGTIRDNESAPTLAIAPAEADEGDFITFTLTLDSASPSDIRLALTTNDIDALGGSGPGADYDNLNLEYFDGTDWQPIVAGEVTLLAGSTTLDVRVATFDDAELELDETFELIATESVPGSLATPSATGIGTIRDNELAPTLTIAPAETDEGDFITFTLTLDSASPSDITLALTTNDIEAVGGSDPGADYDNLNLEYFDGTNWQPIVAGEVTLLAGSTTLDVRVATFDDAELELDETFELIATESVPGSLAVPTATGIGTIRDNESAPTLTIAPAETDEGDFITFTLTLDSASPSDITLALTTNDIEAVGGSDPGADYDNLNLEYFDGTNWQPIVAGEVTLLAGSTTLDVRVATFDDAELELDETFELIATESVPGSLAVPTATGIGTIRDNESAPTLTIAPAESDEGDFITFTLTLDLASPSDITLALATNDIDAVGGSDPVANPEIDYDNLNLEYFDGTDWQPIVAGEVTLLAGSTTLDVRVATFDDAELELDETFELTATETVPGSLATPSATGIGTIRDNEPAPTLTIAPAESDEGDFVTFTLTLDSASPSDITLALTTNDIEAVGGSGPGADYDNLNLEYFDGTNWQPIVAGEVTLLAGSTTLDVRVATFDDAELELDETFELIATESVPGSLATPSATGIGTIRDNEPAPTLTIAPAESDEGDFVTFTLTLDSASPSDITLALTTNDIEAVGGSGPGADYDNLNLEYFDGTDWQPIVAGEVTLLAGSTTLDVRVATFDDAELELDETFELTATETVPGSLATPSATGIGTIRDNEPAPTLTIAPAEADEGDFVTFALTLDSASPSDITLALTTNDIDALGGSGPGADYDNLNLEYFDGTDWQPIVAGEVTLLAGSTTLDVRVATFDDAELELDETFELTATETVPGSLATPSATGIGTIRDNEPAPTLTIAPAETDEGDFITFTLTLDSVSPSDITLALTTNDIDALGGSDPVANPEIDYDNLNLEYFDGTDWQPVVAGEVTLLAGSTTLDVRVATFDDAELELDETFELTATETVPGSLATPSATGIATIRDNEPAPTLTIAPAEADEGDFVTFALTLDSASPSDITLALTTNDIDALGGSGPGADYDNLNLEYFDGTDWQPVVAGEVTLLAGSTTLDVRVATFDDAELELDETFELIATETVPGSLATPSATGIGTIRDNEPAPTLTIAPAETDEGDFITFTLTLDSVSPSDITLALTTNDIDALGGSDPVANPEIDYDNLNLEYFDGTDWQPVVAGEVTLLAGSTTLDVRVATFDDAELELDETFELTATETVPGSLATPSATGIATIRDNDIPPERPLSQNRILNQGVDEHTEETGVMASGTTYPSSNLQVPTGRSMRPGALKSTDRIRPRSLELQEIDHFFAKFLA